MGCLLPVVSLFMPRFVLFFIWILTDWLGRAYDTVMWPLLGFFFMPYTTLAYMAAMLQNDGSVSGGWIVLVVVAVMFDLGGQGSSVKVRTSSS